MKEDPSFSVSIDRRVAERLRALRRERGFTLDDLATRSGVSRSTLSRIENAEVSATAVVLGKLGIAFGLTMSRLIGGIEDDFPPLIRRDDQSVWEDAEAGFHRRQLSPPAATLSGETIEVRLDPGAVVAYDAPPRPGLEHHLVLFEGGLAVEVGGAVHTLSPGDCLRYRLYGPNTFRADPVAGCRYVIFIV